MKILPEQEQLVRDAIGKLSEHFDSVRIFVTVHDGPLDETNSYEDGAGNFYAQLGQIREWISIQDQYQREHAKRKDAENNEE